MATLYGTYVYRNYYSNMPQLTTNTRYTFSFQTSESTIPASNWKNCMQENVYYELMDQANNEYSNNSTGILIFIDSINSLEEERNGNFAFNEEAITLPQNVNNSVSGTLSFIDSARAQQELDNEHSISSACTKTIDNQSISYTITKTGAYAYSMTLTINETESYAMQKNTVHLVKEDADGTKTTQNIELAPSTLTRWSPDASSASITNDFPSNLTTKNLAPGGICFDITEVSTTGRLPVETNPNVEPLH